MKLKEANIEEMKRPSREEIQKIVQEFMDSEMECAEIATEEGEYKTISTLRSSVISSAKKLGLENSIRVRTIKGKVYIYKIDK